MKKKLAVIIALLLVIAIVIGITVSNLKFRGDLTEIGLIISSKEYAIKTIATFMTGILMVYTLTIGTLIWDYELIKTYEREEQ